MKSRIFCLLLVLATPAFATISQVQSKANWSGGTASCGVMPTSGTTSGHLVVFWATWTSTSTLTANVSDIGVNTWYSAVGPTLQSATSTPTSGQIFYAKNVNPTTNTITVNFTGGSATTSGCVFVEYQGADTLAPLDSVSAGYSTSGNQTALLDSGTVTPANSNLLLFAGGVSDSGTANAGANFTGIQSHNFSSGMGITEQNTNAIAGNNTLQRATACLSMIVPCTTVGNWLMQMAVFRDASWTVTGCKYVATVRCVDAANTAAWSGTDVGAWINAGGWPRLGRG